MTGRHRMNLELQGQRCQHGRDGLPPEQRVPGPRAIGGRCQEWLGLGRSRIHQSSRQGVRCGTLGQVPQGSSSCFNTPVPLQAAAPQPNPCQLRAASSGLLQSPEVSARESSACFVSTWPRPPLPTLCGRAPTVWEGELA